VKLRFSLNDFSHLPRMAEMSRKTNQFNLALARLSETDYAVRMADAGGAVVTVSLSDRFSDSGVIGLLAARIDSAGIEIDELLISCRAMGRQLENSIICGALQCLPALPVRFKVTQGARNQPARSWLGDVVEWPADRARSFTPPEGVRVERSCL
jgi:FkbH-like protein